MARLLFVLGIVAVTFMIYSIVDAAFRPARLIRALPKWAWLLIIIVIPLIGGVLWFVIGRGRERQAAVYRTVGPDDDPDFLGKLGPMSPRDPAQDARTEEQIRDLEKRLAEQSGDAAGDKPRDTPRDDPKHGRSEKPGPSL
ncbi:PLDc N-terminal domain-containing protein [Agreia sp. COWG]|uniref:PLDc N-terminal domain-containing protein n=1 Tax=Agreia sp. COWG TaxID=2773266 RepID=UPI001925528C|nr:PLDc N-terminal domain-containing protein [Agreia sp. COWG]CAD5990740.1 Phospholipase_D-nuclease N-terminal [Agreia sp. COWG]